MLKNSKEIFEILSKGGFISQNSVNALQRKYFDLLEDDLNSYREYYEGVGFLLESGNGYFYFVRQESRANAVDKLSRFCAWIDRLDFVKTFNSAFEPGFVFTPSKILEQINCDMELKEKALNLYSDKKKSSEIVEKLIDDFVKLGFVEVENDLDGQYRVVAAFRYLEELVCSLNIVETSDEISK